MAGVRAIEHLLKLAPDAYEITIFGAEPHPNYNRIMLSSVLVGGADMNEIVINDWDWYKDNNITLHTGHKVTKIDTARKRVITNLGLEADYDSVIIATGSNPSCCQFPEPIRRRHRLPGY